MLDAYLSMRKERKMMKTKTKKHNAILLGLTTFLATLCSSVGVFTITANADDNTVYQNQIGGCTEESFIYETSTERKLAQITHKDNDKNEICDDCSAELFEFNGTLYRMAGDITNTGFKAKFDSDLNSFEPQAFHAGEGYFFVTDTENFILYNVTIDLRNSETYETVLKDTRAYSDLNITFYGTNNLYANAEGSCFYSPSDWDRTDTFIGMENAVLNLYGPIIANYLTFDGGIVNAYGTSYNEIGAPILCNTLTVQENTVVNAVSVFNYEGIWQEVTVWENDYTFHGTFNGVLSKVLDTGMVEYTVHGNAVLGQNYIPNPELALGMQLAGFSLVVPESSTLTVPKTLTINLDLFNEVHIEGELIVEGNLICTHTGGEATCANRAICEICKHAYGETLPHTHGTTFESNEAEHWQECTCGDKTNQSAHLDDNADGICDICQYDTTPTNSGTNDPAKKGCGSTLGITLGVLACLGAGIAVALKKKKDNQ